MFVLTLDHGTTSTRAVIFDRAGRIIAAGQREHDQILPRAGWVEHDPAQVWANVREVIGLALARADLSSAEIAAVGIANQRATTVVWDRHSGVPVHHAIVWQDTRTQQSAEELADRWGNEGFADRIGLPITMNFSATKLKWILDHVTGARERAAAGDLLFDNTDT